MPFIPFAFFRDKEFRISFCYSPPILALAVQSEIFSSAEVLAQSQTISSKPKREKFQDTAASSRRRLTAQNEGNAHKSGAEHTANINPKRSENQLVNFRKLILESSVSISSFQFHESICRCRSTFCVSVPFRVKVVSHISHTSPSVSRYKRLMFHE